MSYNNNLLISSAQVSTIRFSNARYIKIEVDTMYIILYIDNSPQGVFQWQFTILEEFKST